MIFVETTSNEVVDLMTNEEDWMERPTYLKYIDQVLVCKQAMVRLLRRYRWALYRNLG
jgi:hypothetical protein